MDRITGRLKRDFSVDRVERVGSHAKGTAVRGFSDVDLFAVFSRDEARKWAPSLTSSTLIRRVRRSVAVTYPTTSLRIDRQAVRIAFEQGAHAIDVVPAIFHEFDARHGAPIFLIPDGQSGWLRTAPELHKRLVEEAHTQSGRKLKALVRMLKWWGAARASTAAFSSLYAEWFVIACEIPVHYRYQEALAAAFDGMVRARLAPLQDPYGVSDRAVTAGKTSLQRTAILGVASQSAERAFKALDAEDRGRFAIANNLWSLVFNGYFPSRIA